MAKKISRRITKIFIILVLCIIDLFHCTKWDELVDTYYPKTCSRDNLFDYSRHGLFSAIPSMVTQVDAYIFVRQGERLVKAMEDMDMSIAREKFPSLAMQHFFTSKLTPEVRMASSASKANLLGSRIMLNKKTSCGRMTPNNFIAFLESKNFRGAPGKRFPVCKKTSAMNDYAPFDGSCNNLLRPSWGAARQPFTRIASHNYADGLYSFPRAKSGCQLPSARLLSSRLMANAVTNHQVLSAMAVYWGQLIAHDMTMRVMEQHGNGGGIQCCTRDGCHELTGWDLHPACEPIPVSHNDPFYSQFGVRCLNFVRSLTTPNGQNTLGPAEQLNSVSSFIDCSPVYGYNEATAHQLRLFTHGLLRMTLNGHLPPTSNASTMCDTSRGHCPCYLTGDSRVNQTPGLTALQTLLVREHNRVASFLSVINPHWIDDQIYHEARKIVIAEVQHITYHEWLPIIIGKSYVQSNNISPSSLFSYDYNPNVNPGVINSFAAGAFRFFHTIVPGELLIIPKNGVQSYIRLSDQYLKPCILEHFSDAVEGVIKGATTQYALNADTSFSPEITNLLFKSSNKWGLDLVAMDIQRGRDHGLASYNTFRSICGLRRAECFDDLIGEITPARISALKQVYENVEDIDLFVGGMMETDVYGSVLGPTFQCIVGEQFYRSRVGDRYFYDVGDTSHSFTPDQMREIKKASMARLICDNTEGIEKVQKYSFEGISNVNPLFNCNDISNIPSVDLNYWKDQQTKK